MMNPLEMLKDLQNLQAKAEEVKARLALIKCTGYAMGNMIEVVATGDLKVESIKIDPSIVREGQESMLEVLVASAVNNAFELVRERISDELRQIGGRYGLSV